MCPAGYECTDKIGTMTMCSIGTYSVGGRTECTPCPGGYACPSIYDMYLIKCSAGYYVETTADEMVRYLFLMLIQAFCKTNFSKLFLVIHSFKSGLFDKDIGDCEPPAFLPLALFPLINPCRGISTHILHFL